MNLISLDGIVKNILLKRKYPHHYYLDFLVPAKDCLRELAFDLPLFTLRYQVLTLNSNHAVEIPNDYQDYAKVSVRIGQYLRPLVEDNGLDLVPNYDSNYEIQPYSTGIASQAGSQTGSYINGYGYFSPYWWMVNWNVFGESTGRQYGGVNSIDTFRVNKERNEIKINEDLGYTEVVLEYIGNGMDADSATHIDGYCQAAIEAYCLWQYKENTRTYSEGEAQVAKRDYEQQVLILRARFSDITIDRLKRIAQRNAIAVKY